MAFKLFTGHNCFWWTSQKKGISRGMTPMGYMLNSSLSSLQVCYVNCAHPTGVEHDWLVLFRYNWCREEYRWLKNNDVKGEQRAEKTRRYAGWWIAGSSPADLMGQWCMLVILSSRVLVAVSVNTHLIDVDWRSIARSLLRKLARKTYCWKKVFTAQRREYLYDS